MKSTIRRCLDLCVNASRNPGYVPIPPSPSANNPARIAHRPWTEIYPPDLPPLSRPRLHCFDLHLKSTHPCASLPQILTFTLRVHSRYTLAFAVLDDFEFVTSLACTREFTTWLDHSLTPPPVDFAFNNFAYSIPIANMFARLITRSARSVRFNSSSSSSSAARVMQMAAQAERPSTSSPSPAVVDVC